MSAAVPADASELLRLWNICFPGDQDYAQWYFSDFNPADTRLVRAADGRIACALHMVPYRLDIRGAARPVRTLTAVGTLPEYRGRGLARALMAQALTDMAQGGAGFTLLYPLSHEFYSPLGWQTCAWADLYVLPRSQSAAPDAQPAQLQTLARIYDAFRAQQGLHCATVRDARAWERRLDEFALPNAGAACNAGAYALYHADDDALEVEEAAWVDPAAILALVSMLRTRAEVALKLPAGISLPGLQPHKRALAHTMLRITDVRLAAAQTRAACAGEVCLHVRDTLLGANDGLFTLRAQAGGAVRCTPGGGRPQMQLSVGQLCALRVGAYTERVPGTGDADAQRLLGAMFPPRRCYTFELC